MDVQPDQSACESEFSEAYEGDISLVESSASVRLSEPPENEDILPMLFSVGAPPSINTSLGRDERGVRKPRTSASGRSDLRKHLVHARLQAELIRAKSKIVQLESELSSQRNQTEHAQIQRTDRRRTTSKSEDMNGTQVERLHQLEKERCDLLEELQSVKAKLSSAENELEEKNGQLKQLKANYDEQKKSLNQEIVELELKNEMLQRDCERMTLDRTNLQTERAQWKQFEAEQLQIAHERSLEVLRSRIEELETVESDLLHSEAQVKELERKLRTFQHNEHFLQSQQQKVLKYDELERQLQHLTEENASLKGQQDNVDLLRYKVQTLQERCARYEGLEAKLAQLELENQHLKEAVKEEGSGEMAMMMMAEDGEGGDSGSVMLGAKVGGGGRSQAALWYRIAELQQKEVLLTAKQGELTSSLNLAQVEAADAKASLEEVRRKLTKEQSDSHSKDERIQRLEKRLTFVTKERDGCVNVLKSYKLDSGVDALLRESLNEMEQQLTRANDRISELEEELGHYSTDNFDS